MYYNKGNKLLVRKVIFVNEYIEVAGKIKDTVSEFIPAKLSVIIKLAELALDTFGKADDSLNNLYKKAFKEAVENVAKGENVADVRDLLSNCKEINSLEDAQNLTKYLKKTSTQMGLFLSEKDILPIAEKIGENFNNILLEDKYDMLYKWFLLCRNSSGLNSELIEIKEMLHEIYDRKYQVETDNKSYALNYISPLFMHRQTPIISLKDIFVMPDAMDENGTYNTLDVIRDFMNEDYNVLFIEGCGGYGKSSIVSFLAYNYIFNSASDDISFFANRQLIIVRLRECTGENRRIEAIIKRLNNMDAVEKDAVLIFDGLDELCMMDNDNGSVIATDIIKAFSYYNRKIIITSRPTCVNYSNVDSLDITYDVIELCCFDEIQRIEFAESFAKIDKKHIEALEYIKNLPLEKQENESIYGSPFLLYLILSGGIKEEEKENSWLLMRRLFHDDLFNPPYSYDRGIDKKTAKIIYQFNCDISYEMFKTENIKLFMTNEELKKILPNDNIKDTVKESHGLFSYMRKSNNGAVEFVHNHIRDYFLCEKILIEIDKWYSDSTISGNQVALKLGELLKYDYFTNEVKMFIKEAIQHCYLMENSIDQKKRNHSVYKTILNKCYDEHLSSVFDWFYKCGGAVSYDFNYSEKRSFLEFSNCIINNAAYIYKTIYECKYKFAGYSKMFFNWVSEDLRSRFTKNSIFVMFKMYLYNACLCSAYLENADLSSAVLNEANLQNADLQGADLSKAELYNADLRGAVMYRVNLEKAKLHNAKLHCAKLINAYLHETDLYEAKLVNVNLYEAYLSEAKLVRTDLREADLYRANLCKANLYEADIWAADFREADLRGANLQSVKNISCAVFWNTLYNDKTTFPDGFNVSKPEFIKIQ